MCQSVLRDDENFYCNDHERNNTWRILKTTKRARKWKSLKHWNIWTIVVVSKRLFWCCFDCDDLRCWKARRTGRKPVDHGTSDRVYDSYAYLFKRLFFSCHILLCECNNTLNISDVELKRRKQSMSCSYNTECAALPPHFNLCSRKEKNISVRSRSFSHSETVEKWGIEKDEIFSHLHFNFSSFRSFFGLLIFRFCLSCKDYRVLEEYFFLRLKVKAKNSVRHFPREKQQRNSK